MPPVGEEKRQVVRMRDLELYAIQEEPEPESDEDADMEEVTFWGESGGQQQQQQERTEKEKESRDDVGPVLKAWLKSVDVEDSAKTNKKDVRACLFLRLSVSLDIMSLRALQNRRPPLPSRPRRRSQPT